MVSTKEIKEELDRRIGIVTQPDFLESRVRPCLGPEDELDGTWEARVLQLDGTGAATVELKIGPQRVFAKLYPNDSGQFIYEKLKALRANSFGSGERYQSLEPMGYISEYGMLLTREAPGTPVSGHIGVDDTALMDGVKEAGRWLAKLHTSPLRIGRSISLLQSGELLPLASRLAKVISRRPAYLDIAVEMIKGMEKLAEDTIEGVFVQSHGQYRPIHVFISDSSVTVIDLDRSRPCDPARDVAEFIHRLRMTMFRQRGSAETADAPTQAFLEAYASAVSDGSYLTNLPFHRARYMFHSLSKELKESDSEDPSGAASFYRSEFEKVLEGRPSI